jgi:hypothetical protein
VPRHNKTAIFSFPDIRVRCHCIMSLVWPEQCLLVCREVFSWFAGFTCDLLKTKSKFGYLRKYRQMSAVTSLQLGLQDVSSNILATHVARLLLLTSCNPRCNCY